MLNGQTRRVRIVFVGGWKAGDLEADVYKNIDIIRAWNSALFSIFNASYSWSCSTGAHWGLCAGIRSCHCGMDICSNLSLVSQHMCGWPHSGYYCNLGAIGCNPFLVAWKLIIPLSSGGQYLTGDDLRSCDEELWVCCSSCAASLSAHLRFLYEAGVASQGKTSWLRRKNDCELRREEMLYICFCHPIFCVILFYKAQTNTQTSCCKIFIAQF